MYEIKHEQNQKLNNNNKIAGTGHVKQLLSIVGGKEDNITNTNLLDTL